jgi:hypothetical protein
VRERERERGGRGSNDSLDCVSIPAIMCTLQVTRQGFSPQASELTPSNSQGVHKA